MNPLATDHQPADLELRSELTAHEPSIQQLRQVDRLFYGRGWSVGTSSNYSVVVSRQPHRLLITASGMDKGGLRPNDFVVIDEDGQPVGDDQPKSSAETLLHCLLTKDESVGAVLHTHSVWATVLSDVFAEQAGFDIEGFEMLKGLEGVRSHDHREWVDIFENSQDIAQLANLIESRWQERGQVSAHGFLLRRHGLYTWGRDLFAARRHVEIFEFLFECLARQRQLQT